MDVTITKSLFIVPQGGGCVIGLQGVEEASEHLYDEDARNETGRGSCGTVWMLLEKFLTEDIEKQGTFEKISRSLTKL